ncbi:uncharacterized protein BX663DRAFT_489072 [Cokeromyces recurvatus]|uniref:uncharacterized protein n=1 Tax=Cokeromyces recurvatus TaxID=90255 RepID=UPI00222107E4|nr:uncharacterized protein BX663DRAFT_489072 [Cokeromyces recurvatus]KAI7899626.1 hypothetical protein BX663DRAFT_489072 [Cokeromyces recurvatus]
MKAAKYLTLPLAYAVCLLLLSNEAQAKASTTKQLEDISQWTKDQVQAYLDKYQIYYDKNVNDESLWETAKKYRDAAAIHSDFFLHNDNSISRLVEGLKIKLEKQYNLADNSVDGLLRDVNHELKQLELSGNLKQDKVKQALDKYQTKAVKQKYVTAAQWKEISKDIESLFASHRPPWYQRIFSGASTTNQPRFYNDDHNAFHSWLTKDVAKRLETNKELSKEEIQSIIDTLKDAITRTSNSAQDISKLGNAAWWEQVSNDLQRQGKLKQIQTQGVIDSLKDDINAYKIFVMDYANEATDQTKGYLDAIRHYVMDTGYGLYQSVFHPFKSHPKRDAQVNSALSTASSAAASATNAAASSANSAANAAANAAAYATDAAAYATDAAAASASSLVNAAAASASSLASAASSATDAAAASASSLGSHITDTAYETQQGLGRFWRQKELETYRKMGYTEAHINWIENYLSKAFHNKKNLTKDTIQQAIHTIRQYLINAKVQTISSVDSQLKSLEALIENWRRYIIRDEL